MEMLSERIWINRWELCSCTVLLYAIISCYIIVLQRELEHPKESRTSSCKKDFLASVPGGLVW